MMVTKNIKTSRKKKANFSHHVPVRDALAVAVDWLGRIGRVRDARERPSHDAAGQARGSQKCRARGAADAAPDSRRSRSRAARGRCRGGGGGRGRSSLLGSLLRGQLRRALAAPGLAPSPAGPARARGALASSQRAAGGNRGQKRRRRRVLGEAVPDALPGQLRIERREVHVEPADLRVDVVVDLLGELRLLVRVLEDLFFFLKFFV